MRAFSLVFGRAIVGGDHIAHGARRLYETRASLCMLRFISKGFGKHTAWALSASAMVGHISHSIMNLTAMTVQQIFDAQKSFGKTSFETQRYHSGFNSGFFQHGFFQSVCSLNFDSFFFFECHATLRDEKSGSRMLHSRAGSGWY